MLGERRCNTLCNMIKKATTDSGIVHHLTLLLCTHTPRVKILIEQENCKHGPYLPYSFGEVLQRGDYLLITSSKGKILDRKKRKSSEFRP